MDQMSLSYLMRRECEGGRKGGIQVYCRMDTGGAVKQQ